MSPGPTAPVDLASEDRAGSVAGADERGSGMRRAAVGAVMLVLTSMLQLALPFPAAALTLPPGFQLVDYTTGQAAYNLTDFAWLDDGGLLTSGKDGTITYVPPGGTARVVGTVPSVRAVADHGLLGLALANDYAESGHVYVTYDKGDPAGTGFGMVEEWTAFPPAAPTSFTLEETLVDGSRTSPQLLQAGLTHAIDSVLVAPDDTLFVSIGDNAGNNGDPLTLRAQDLDQPYGKILHLRPDGRGVASNPWFTGTSPRSWRSMVYASGFRNPFRLSLDPRSGVVHLGDVGWGRTEEVDTVRSGANAGWPCYEGVERTTFSSSPVCKALYAAGSARMPIWTYAHEHAHAAVVGGVHYTGTSYPAAYQDAYFFGDYSRGRLWTLTTDTAGRLTRAPEPEGFATDAGGPVAFHAGPNGDVTYADIVSGDVRRLVYQSGNRAPIARLVPTTDADTRTVGFDAGGSYDLDGDALTYHWDFGDGSSAEGITAEHTYESADPVVATLTVTDQLGATGSTTAAVHPANHTPRLTITTPPSSRTYAVGETVELSATATDPEDGELTVTWDTALEHCPFAGSCHLHPDGATTGPTYAQPFTDHGSDTTMVVTVHAEDGDGAVTTTTYDAAPRLHTLVVDSPVAVTVNGVPAVAAEVVAGSEVQLDAPSTSSYWEFRGWSDGGPAAHAFTMPDGDLRLVARYRSAIARAYAALGRAAFLGEPTSPEYDVTGGRARNYVHGRLLWSRRTGAHEVHGRLLAKYASIGGPASCLGFPVTDVRPVRGGVRSEFTGGRLTYRRATGKVTVRC